MAGSGFAGAAAVPPVAPVPPLAHVGRWLTDATGRVVMLHGVNDVAKSAPYYSAARGFGADDAAFLASEGFNALRLGVDMRGLMPLPGQLDDACGARAIATPSKPRRTAGARTRNWDPATLR